MTEVRILTRRAAELLAALMVAAGVGALTLFLVNLLPFDQPSWLPRSFGTVLIVGVVVLTGWALLRRATGDRALWLLGTAGPAFLASTHLGLLLHGTPHYLNGLGGDQLNRVAYLTRFTDSASLADPFYADAAPFYPPQWFWIGGRLAALSGVDGWDFYKTYAIVTMAVAGAVAFVAWRWLVPARLAVLFGLVTTVTGIHANAYEPYSWILICVLPQIVVATHLVSIRIVAADSATDRRATWPLVVTIGVYLGTAALGYTLIAGFAALTVGIVVLAHAWSHRRDRATVGALSVRLAAMAGISAAIALLFWHRYLFAVIGGVETEPSVANDFAPESIARLPLPMLEFSASGALCLIGSVWVVVTVWPRVPDAGANPDAPHNDAPHDDTPSDDTAAESAAAADPPISFPLPTPALAQALARSVCVIALTVFGWFLASGLRSVAGSTLLPFRLIPVLTLALSLAGVVGAMALVRWALTLHPARTHGRTLAAAVIVAGLAAIQLAQHVSEEESKYEAAARKTDGAPTDVLTAIDEMTPGRSPSELVLLTTDPSLIAYRPYFAFQAPAQAYATPAARYEARLDEIRRWSQADTAAELDADLDRSEFRAPDVIVLNREAPGRWEFVATINEMPRKQNNSREKIVFTPNQFDDPSLFDVRHVGKQTVVARR